MVLSEKSCPVKYQKLSEKDRFQNIKQGRSNGRVVNDMDGGWQMQILSSYQPAASVCNTRFQVHWHPSAQEPDTEDWLLCLHNV